MRDNTKRADGNVLGSAPLGGLICRFAIPSIVAMLVNAAYNLTDQIFIGHVVGMLGNAATNVAFPVVSLTIGLALMAGAGTAANFNICLGAKQEEEAKCYVGTGLTLMLLFGVALAAVVLLAFALLFGIVLGYAVGRSAGIRQASQAGAQPDALNTLAPQDAAMPSAEQIEAENAAALSALSGEDGQTDGDSALLMGIEDFGTESGASVPAEGEGEVVAEFNGGQLYSGEVLEEYNAELARYVFEGYSEADVSQGLLDEVLENMVAERVLELHAQDLGLYELTAEDEAQIAAQAQQDYEEQVRYYRSLVRTEGMSDEETEAAAREELLANEGVSLETLEADINAGWWMEKLYDALVADVTIGSSEIVTAYNEALADQKERFLASAEDYEAAQVGGDVIVYNLPGYRRVKMVGLSFDSFDSMTAVDGLNTQLAALDASADAEQIAELQAQLDAYYAPLEERADALLCSGAGGYIVTANPEIVLRCREDAAYAAAVNGANEAAVALFLKEQIGYLDIGEAVCAVADTFPADPVTSVEDVLAADRAARAYVTEKFSK